jgi:hypothetical protein
MAYPSLNDHHYMVFPANRKLFSAGGIPPSPLAGRNFFEGGLRIDTRAVYPIRGIHEKKLGRKRDSQIIPAADTWI